MWNGHEPQGSCGSHPLMTTTAPRRCPAIIFDPLCPVPPGRCRALDQAEAPDLLAYLAHITDPRQPRGRWHPLVAILALAAPPALTGARSMTAIAEWALTAHNQCVPRSAPAVLVPPTGS